MTQLMVTAADDESDSPTAEPSGALTAPGEPEPGQGARDSARLGKLAATSALPGAPRRLRLPWRRSAGGVAGARWSLWALFVLAMAVGQVTFLSRAGSGFGNVCLVLAAILAVAHTLGPLHGAGAGAAAGLLTDLLPPASAPLGGWMLIMCLLAAAYGHLVEINRPGPFASLAAFAATCGLAIPVRAAVLWFAGIAVPPAVIARTTLYTAGWGLLLAPAALALAFAFLAPRNARPCGPARWMPAASPGHAASEVGP
ncbi:MAG: hypothetical protein ACOYEV_02820 [Candidatus Nanopelagicales bacterium]